MLNGVDVRETVIAAWKALAINANEASNWAQALRYAQFAIAAGASSEELELNALLLEGAGLITSHCVTV